MLSSIFIIAAMAALLPAILMAPHASILVWSWISYMNPHRNTWSFAKNFPILDGVAAFTFLAWLTSRERKLPPAHPVSIVMFVLFVWICVTTMLAQYSDGAMVKFDKFWKIILFTFFTMTFITTQQRIRHLIYIILLGLSLYSIRGGIFTILNGGQYIVFGPADSFLSDNNQLALAFLTVIPFFYWTYRHGEAKFVRYAAAAGGVLTLISVMGSHSRGALVAMAAMTLWMFGVTRRWVVGSVITAVVAFSVLTFMPDEWVDRMNSISTYEEDQSAETRLLMWKYSLNVAEANPIVGGGFNFIFDQTLARQYMPGNGKIFVAHSIYFDTVGEHGFVGLFLYLLLLCCALMTNWETRRITKGIPDAAWARDLAQMLQVSLIGFAVGGSFLSLSTFDLYFHIVALSMMVHFAAMQQINPAAAKADFPMFRRSGADRSGEGSAVPAE